MKGRVKALLRRALPPLVYALACAGLILALRPRAIEHVMVLNDEEWQPIQDFVRAHRRGDEPICFLPRWTKGHAVDEYKFRNIALLASPAEAFEGREEPLPGFWVVSEFDAFDPEDVPADLYPSRQHRALGGADIWLFRREAGPELPDSLLFHVPEAACVLHLRGGRRLPFEWYRTGYSLPRGSDLTEHHDYLGCRATADRFAGRPHMGIWFHPPVPGESLSLTWPAVEALPWLAVSGGIRDRVASGRGAPVKLQVILDGRTLRTLSFPSTRGWKTYALPTGLRAGRARLAFRVSADDNHSRHFVFDAEMSASRPPASEPDAPTGGLSPSSRRARGGGRRTLGGPSPPP